MSYGIMIKTVSEDCNLACRYCYYSHVLGKPQGVRTPSRTTLEKILHDYLQTCGPTASISWQGGEPLLAGLSFFRQAIALEIKYGHPGMIISNALQTNGVLLTQEWARFFKRYRFLVGVSIDGPESLHNRYRLDAGGRGTFRRVMLGVDWLRRESVDFNVLTVVGPHNVHRVGELFEFYEKEKFNWIQFIPQMLFSAQNTRQPGMFAITPQEYGDFLCEAFDRWYNLRNPTVSIRYFDTVLQTYLQQLPDICTLEARCPQHLTIESNGDVYACDFYLSEVWRLGNVEHAPLPSFFSTPTYQRFSELKPQLPTACVSCPWLSHCQGGCPRNRTWDSTQALETTDYFCAAFKQFFSYTDGRFRLLARALQHRQRSS